MRDGIGGNVDSTSSVTNITATGNAVLGDASDDKSTVTGELEVAGFIDLNGTATSTNAALDLGQSTTGKCLFINQDNTADPGNCLEIDDQATGATSEVVKIASARTGVIANVIAEGDASTILILEADAAASSSRVLLIDRNNTGGTESSIEIDDEGTGASTCFKVASKTTGTVALFDAEGAIGTAGVEVQAADGIDAKPTLLIDNNETNGVATGIQIDIASTGAANAFIITAVATNAGPIITGSVATDCAVDQVGAVVRISNGTTTYYIPCLTSYT